MRIKSELMDHERFEQLAALAAIGQLTALEYAELKAHIDACSACRARHGEFAEILHHQLPLLHPTTGRDSDSSQESYAEDQYKERFLARASAEGLPFAPASVAMQTFWGKLREAFAPAPVYAYAMIFLLVILAGFLAHQWRETKSQYRARLSDVARLADETTALRKRLADLSQARPDSPAARATDSEGSTAGNTHSGETSTEARLRNQLANSRVAYTHLALRYKAIGEQLKNASTEIQALRAEIQAGRDKESSLSSSLQQSEAALTKMTEELEGLRKVHAEDVLTLTDRQVQVDELEKQLAAEAESLSRTRRLLAADRDIRDLMGGRNLHITDVYDVDSKGRTRQLFGRVFYTKGKSLIFYAFDLGKPKASAAAHSYQAWGYQESTKGPVKSLGILYLDDQSQNRWALKFDDPAVLAEIDAVFVTVEPPGGSEKPTGQKLLYAYLGGLANHP